jgi:serine/threonine protein kinase
MLTPDLVLDGYRLIREIGRGGFGEVWLCRLEVTGEYKAFKFLSATNADHLERELEALIRYRAVVAQVQSSNLVSIEHVNRTASGLFYTMPLADDPEGRLPNDPEWQPETLDSLIQRRKVASMWFSAEEIRTIILPLLDAAQRLSDAGIVHRDIKPENILFIGGAPCLGDVSLLTDDSATLTRRGTPGYAAPSWYMESNGNPDMWGVSTTFFSLVTGNAPDKVGRAAFLWPPQGEQSVNREGWKEFHRIILRATHENPTERFMRFDAIAEALYSPDSELPILAAWPRLRHWKALAASILLVGGLVVWSSGYFRPQSAVPAATNTSVSASPQFEQKLGLLKTEFEDLFKEARAAIYVDTPEDKVNTRKMEALLKRLKEQRRVSIDEVREVFSGIERLAPALQIEFRPLDEKLCQDYQNRVRTVVAKAEPLATNAEEGFKAQRVHQELEKTSNAFFWNILGPRAPGEGCGSHKIFEAVQFDQTIKQLLNRSGWSPEESAEIQRVSAGTRERVFGSDQSGDYGMFPKIRIPAAPRAIPKASAPEAKSSTSETNEGLPVPPPPSLPPRPLPPSAPTF